LKVATADQGALIEIGHENDEFPLFWTPDGNSIITGRFLNRKYTCNIINLTDHQVKPIDGLTTFFAPSFSPDFSKVLVYQKTTNQPFELSILPVSIKECKITGQGVVIFQGFDGSPLNCSWSPDGSKIAVCNRGEVYVCDAGGGIPRQLTTTSIIENYPLWSADGSSIAVFISETTELRIIRSSDGELIRSFENVEYYDWTSHKDEIMMAFHDGSLSLISVSSGNIRNIANWREISHCSGLNNLECSPDDKWVAFNGSYDNFDIGDRTFFVNVLDGKGTDVDPGETGNKQCVVWSPDSKWISFYSEGNKKTRLEGTLWEADLTEFMNKIEPGKETGITADFDFATSGFPSDGSGPDGSFTDPRDNHVYHYKKIGNQTWMTENLVHLPAVSPDSIVSPVEPRYYVYGYSGTDVPSAINTKNYQEYGVLYNWAAAVNGSPASNSTPSKVQGVCPVGWHLPSDGEWMILEEALGMSKADLVKQSPAMRRSGYVGNKLKSKDGWEDDDIFIGLSGFNAVPGGINGATGRPFLINQFANFWTTTSINNKLVIRSITNSGPGIYRQSALATWPAGTFPQTTPVGRFAISVRCVKDN